MTKEGWKVIYEIIMNLILIYILVTKVLLV